MINLLDFVTFPPEIEEIQFGQQRCLHYKITKVSQVMKTSDVSDLNPTPCTISALNPSWVRAGLYLSF